MTTHWTPEQPTAFSPPAGTPATDARGELVDAFRSMASEIAETDLSHVTEDDVIGDLGLDSLSMLELVGSLEREYDIRIPEEELVSIRKVRELLQVVERERAR
jgi:acyl carrier protein